MADGFGRWLDGQLYEDFREDADEDAGLVEESAAEDEGPEGFEMMVSS